MLNYFKDFRKDQPFLFTILIVMMTGFLFCMVMLAVTSNDPSKEQKFLDEIKGRHSYSQSDEALLVQGNRYCRQLTSGFSIENILPSSDSVPDTETRVALEEVIVSAVHNLCPNFNNDLDVYLHD